MRKATKKTRWMRNHAKQRALERYNIDLNRQDLETIRLMIQRPELHKDHITFVERQTIDRTVWLVKYKEKQLKVVYSKRHKSIVTVLPNNEEESCQI